MKHITLIVLITFGLNSVCAQQDFSAVDKYVNAVKKETGLDSGTAIAVVKGGKIIYQANFGYADIKENKKVDNKTVFYIASVTKPLFALASLLMEDKGDIKDHTSMSEMFPELKLTQIDADKVQLKHLASHSHALANLPMQDTLAFTGQHDLEHRHVLAAATVKNENIKLGDFEYSNLGYNLISLWAEDYYKQDWQKTIAELVYQPLAMKQTTSYISEAQKKGFKMAQPYGFYVDDPTEILPFFKSDQTMQAAGGTISTATDMAQFLIAQLNQGKIYGKQVFPEYVINKSHQQLAILDKSYRDFKRKGYAWGWYIGPYKGEELYHHFGGIPGTHTHLSYMLKHNVGLVVLNNESTVSSKMTNGIADIVYSLLLNKHDTETLANKHIQEMKEFWLLVQEDIRATALSHKNRNDSRTMQLSQDKLKYTGVYNNRLWGDLTIELLSSDDFKVSFGAQQTIATAAKKSDELRVQFPAMGGGKIISFEIKEGNVNGLKIYGINPLAVEIFTRKK